MMDRKEMDTGKQLQRAFADVVAEIEDIGRNDIEMAYLVGAGA